MKRGGGSASRLKKKVFLKRSAECGDSFAFCVQKNLQHEHEIILRSGYLVAHTQSRCSLIPGLPPMTNKGTASQSSGLEKIYKKFRTFQRDTRLSACSQPIHS